MEITQPDLYREAPDIRLVVINIVFSGGTAFSAFSEKVHGAAKSVTSNSPDDTPDADRKAHQQLIEEFHGIQAKYLVPAAQSAERIIGQTKDLTDGKLFDVNFDQTLHSWFGVSKSRVKPLAALFEQTEGVENVIIEMGMPQGIRFNGTVRCLRFDLERTPVINIDQLRELSLYDDIHNYYNELGLDGLVRSARRTAQRSTAFLEAKR